MIEDLDVQKIVQQIYHNLIIVWLFTVCDFSFKFSFPFNAFIYFLWHKQTELDFELNLK